MNVNALWVTWPSFTSITDTWLPESDGIDVYRKKWASDSR